MLHLMGWVIGIETGFPVNLVKAQTQVAGHSPMFYNQESSQPSAIASRGPA